MNNLNNSSLATDNTSPEVSEEEVYSQDKEAEVQVVKLEQLINDPNCEFRSILHQIYKVATVLHRLSNRENKIYAQNKELEMFAEVKNVKGTYNNWKVVTITIVSGG
ncbi:MAG: hypothetical protein K940chlam7_01888, partial [Chlamydiae bacterium]|nr:hypothetical protein [Chlamydiota bacterium]